MAFKNPGNLKPFENKIWLASPTMHGEELQYIELNTRRQEILLMALSMTD